MMGYSGNYSVEPLLQANFFIDCYVAQYIFCDKAIYLNKRLLRFVTFRSLAPLPGLYNGFGAFV